MIRDFGDELSDRGALRWACLQDSFNEVCNLSFRDAGHSKLQISFGSHELVIETEQFESELLTYLRFS
jgi:hypothetical protein